MNNKIGSVLKTLSGAQVEKDNLYLKKILGFTGVSGSGVTTIAIGVAHTLAKKGHTVLYIDTRIMFPTSYSYLISKKEYSSNSGDLLSISEREYKDVIAETKFENLWCVYAKNRGVFDIVSPRENYENIADFLTKVRDAYDFIVLDISSEITNINSASITMADVIYQVWDENVTSFLNYKNFIAYLCEMGAHPSKVPNIILNKRSKRLHLPDKIFKEGNLRLIATLPGSYTIKELTWKGLTICQLVSMDAIDQLFMEKFQLIIDDIFDRFGESQDSSDLLEDNDGVNVFNESDTLVKKAGRLFRKTWRQKENEEV